MGGGWGVIAEAGPGCHVQALMSQQALRPP